jgi:DNA-directed RNA polymerase specialized sigma subunit
MAHHSYTKRPHPAARTRRDAAKAGTLACLAEQMAQRLGRAPTDAELAAMLARSPASIARLRRLAEGGR